MIIRYKNTVIDNFIIRKDTVEVYLDLFYYGIKKIQGDLKIYITKNGAKNGAKPEPS